MTEPRWPSDLPQAALVAGYQQQPPNLIIRTETEAGVAKVRRRFTAGARRLNMAFLMTGAQVIIFDAFYLQTLEGGALRFDFAQPGNTAYGWCRIIEPPTYEPAGSGALYWRVALAIEALP